MVVRGVEMFSGLADLERDGSGWSPLRQITDLCGLTLGGGVDEHLESPAFGSEAAQPARGRNHLKLVSGAGHARSR